ncbi:hypothetical protein ABKP09_11290, partial [Peribacillus frigoritolerans]|uniref:hypothetical protein n=1 Tax=Peribacillus frigoritolerans TaxID=450367 RepID=UPI0032B3C85A
GFNGKIKDNKHRVELPSKAVQLFYQKILNCYLYIEVFSYCYVVTSILTSLWDFTENIKCTYK